MSLATLTKTLGAVGLERRDRHVLRTDQIALASVCYDRRDKTLLIVPRFQIFMTNRYE